MRRLSLRQRLARDLQGLSDWVTDYGDRLQRLRCRVGSHLPAAQRQTAGDLTRLTGQDECLVCGKELGPIEASFIASFPELFRWHRRRDG